MSKNPNEGRSSLSIPRRTVLKASLAALTAPTLVGCSTLQVDSQATGSRNWPRYRIRRAADDLYMEVTAFGYEERRFLADRWLYKTLHDARLIFRLPPQHYAERAIANAGQDVSVIGEAQLSAIDLVASAPAEIVLLDSRERIAATLDALLDWSRARTVLPDLAILPPYTLSAVAPSGATTRIELPWGIELTPVARDPSNPSLTASGVTWELPVNRLADTWMPVWTASLTDVRIEGRGADFEVYSVRGFEYRGASGSIADGTYVVEYRDAPDFHPPDESGRVTALRSRDRLDIATSLSRRFPYTGVAQPTVRESAILHYESAATNVNTCSTACYAPGRTVSVAQYRVSAHGGWLHLEGAWKPYPGCALTGWSNDTSLGRDHQVKVVDAGFLYPFGIRAELVVLTERAFVKDTLNHFVAPQFKHTFLRINRPNDIKLTHPESPFEYLTITTVRTPPLDLPAGATDPGVYRDFDYFVPMVGGQPFQFDHKGTDWAGQQFPSSMPMVFVSNRALGANGLIWEANSSWSHTHASSPCGSAAGPASSNQIPKSGDGLRVVDKLWNQAAHRFAQYGGALISLARSVGTGETAQRVQWVEWVRGQVPKPGPSGIAETPFIPRARTLKFQAASLSCLAGEPKWSLGTYRNTRTTATPWLDPEPTAPDDLYRINLADRDVRPADPYLHVLERRDLIGEASAVAPEPSAAAAARIRQLYYGTAAPSQLPADLFESIDNEIRFGVTGSSESTGGLSVPDTHVSTITRGYGPVGDATFNPGRWSGYTPERKARLEGLDHRLDYAAYRAKFRRAIDVNPFDAAMTVADLQAADSDATQLMGFQQQSLTLQRVAGRSRANHLVKLGEMFGADAQILPGLNLKDILRNILASDESVESDGIRSADVPDAGQPPTWSFRVTGIDGLLQVIGNSPNQFQLKDVIEAARTAQDPSLSIPLPIGVEASLQWVHDRFEDVDLGVVKFHAQPSTQLSLSARAAIDVSEGGLPLDLASFSFSAGKTSITSSASMRDFSVLVFSAIEIFFNSVRFKMLADGSKDFTTDIADIKLTGALAFVNQLSEVIGGLGGGGGIETELSPARIRIGQTLRFPKNEGEPLLIGPAQVTRLSLAWAVVIPLTGRDVMSASFAVSSREAPLTIYVPPWYGGRAYIYLEVTTRGVRMLEFSMEYGAYVPVAFGIAVGEAGIMAGIYYSLKELPGDGGMVDLRAFVKAFANLTVAGFIQFSGLIYIGLNYQRSPTGHQLVGVSEVTVSIKIGFIRYSYSFRAEKTLDQGGGEASSRQLQTLRNSTAAAPDEEAAFVLFPTDMLASRREAFERVIAGYREELV